MNIAVGTYIPANSCIHRADARTKIALLAAYSTTLFLVQTWAGIGLCAAACAVCLLASRIPPKRLLPMLLPVCVLMLLVVAFNAFLFDAAAPSAGAVAVSGAGASAGMDGVSAGFLADAPFMPLAGSFGFSPAGCARGCFYAARIALLVAASLILCYTTTSTDMTAALGSFLSSLRGLRVPVDDIASVLSIALRFIPLMASELKTIRDAQWARGGSFGEGSFARRLRAWATVLLPLFVGMFRHADSLAIAMDARCYGAAGRRTSLAARRFLPGAAISLCVGFALLALIAFFL